MSTTAKRAPSLKLNFTKTALDNLPLPEHGQRSVYHDTKVNGLQLRVTANGVKSFYIFMRVNGRPERVKVGEHAYPIMSIDQAREEAKGVIARIAKGESPSAAKRESKAKALTLAEAVNQYVADKRRRTDKLPLKQRTVDDYLNMLKPPRLTAAGKRTKGGALARLAGKSIYALTAEGIKSVHAENLKLRSSRQCFYAMQTLAAVLRFFAVKIPQDPFSAETREADRIYLEKAGVSETEPVEHLLNHLGEWWRALKALPPSPVSDYIAFLALTGCRPSEPLKVLVGDLVNGEVRLKDTKNRSDHVLLLSTQALAIAQRNAEGRAANDRLFPVTPAKVNELAHELSAATGIPFTSKMLRSLFASIADELVSSSTLRRLMNHKRGDITDVNYIRKLKETLRSGWQAIADHVEAIAAENVVSIRGAAS